MSREATSDGAFRDATDDGYVDRLKEKFLRAFMEKPRTTWDAARAIDPENPFRVNKDGTAAVNWLRRTRLVTPTGDKVVPEGKTRPSGVLEASPKAEAFLAGEYHPNETPTERSLLVAIKKRAVDIRNGRLHGMEELDGLLDQLEASLARYDKYVPPKTAEDVLKDKRAREEARQRRDLRSPRVQNAARDGIWIRRNDPPTTFILMDDAHLERVVKRCRKEGIEEGEQPLMAALEEATKRGFAW